MLYAVAARDARCAADFAERFGASRSYGSYRTLVENPDVDIVYIATTHPVHREQALMAIDAGKPFLIQKPLALNATHAREVLTAARDKGVFAMEAVWMRASPLILRARELTARTPERATIAGTAGSITAEPWFLNPAQLLVITSEGDSRIDVEQAAYGPQIEEVERCLRSGLLESPLAPHADTIAVLELIDRARGDLGVLYPAEG